MLLSSPAEVVYAVQRLFSKRARPVKVPAQSVRTPPAAWVSSRLQDGRLGPEREARHRPPGAAVMSRKPLAGAHPQGPCPVVVDGFEEALHEVVGERPRRLVEVRPAPSENAREPAVARADPDDRRSSPVLRGEQTGHRVGRQRPRTAIEDGPGAAQQPGEAAAVGPEPHRRGAVPFACLEDAVDRERCRLQDGLEAAPLVVLDSRQATVAHPDPERADAGLGGGFEEGVHGVGGQARADVEDSLHAVVLQHARRRPRRCPPTSAPAAPSATARRLVTKSLGSTVGRSQHRSTRHGAVGRGRRRRSRPTATGSRRPREYRGSCSPSRRGSRCRPRSGPARPGGAGIQPCLGPPRSTRCQYRRRSRTAPTRGCSADRTRSRRPSTRRPAAGPGHCRGWRPRAPARRVRDGSRAVHSPGSGRGRRSRCSRRTTARP